MTEQQITTVKMLLRTLRKGKSYLHNGMCEDGADKQMLRISKQLGYETVPHPGGDAEQNRKRNREIVKVSDIVVTTPFGRNEMRRGSGTWMVIRETRRAAKPLYIVWPDGSHDLDW